MCNKDDRARVVLAEQVLKGWVYDAFRMHDTNMVKTGTNQQPQTCLEEITGLGGLENFGKNVATKSQ